jgi:hypothetical protein
MGDSNDVLGDIVCKKGIVKMGENNDVQGDVYAMELKRGDNCDIGGFHKTEK